MKGQPQAPAPGTLDDADALDEEWLARRRAVLAFRASTDTAGHPHGWLADSYTTDPDNPHETSNP